MGIIGRAKRVSAQHFYCGQVVGEQIKDLQEGIRVVIGTPGRILDHLRRGTLNLNQVEIMVLDEADEMLDMGFIDDIESVMKYLPRHRQLLLFSATMPPAIRQLAQKYMRKPRYVTVSRG